MEAVMYELCRQRVKPFRVLIYNIIYKMNDKLNLNFGQSVVYNVDIDHVEKITPSNDEVGVFKEGMASMIDMFNDIRSKTEL